MRIVTKNNLERGMDLQWISMFPGESERLLAPLTFMNKPKKEKFQTIEVNGITLTVVEIQVTAPPMSNVNSCLLYNLQEVDEHLMLGCH